jgi:recombination protein RecA
LLNVNNGDKPVDETTKTISSTTKKSRKKKSDTSQIVNGELDATIRSIENTFGKGSVIKLNGDKISNVSVIPTGSLSLDVALGIGNFTKQKVCLFILK